MSIPNSDGAGPARGERPLAVLRRREPVADVGPTLAIRGSNDGKAASHRVAHGEAVALVPEGEAVIECAGVAAGELVRPGSPGVPSLIDAGPIAGSGGEQIRDALAHPFDIAELEAVRARHHAAAPALAAVGGDREGPTDATGPGDPIAHGADRLETIGGAACLRNQLGAAGRTIATPIAIAMGCA
jgi:hypothetical protein